MSITTTGLLLQSIPYLGKKKILKIFTPNQGLISLFTQSNCLSPFCLAEWVYRNQQKEIHSLQDASLIDPFLHLRENYTTLCAAGTIAQDLLRTQLPSKEAPKLFELAIFYLKNLSLNPDLLAASFRLKLLLHEGLFSCDRDPTFTAAEWDQVQTLAFSRSLTSIQNVKAAPHSKIRSLLDERL